MPLYVCCTDLNKKQLALAGDVLQASLKKAEGIKAAAGVCTHVCVSCVPVCLRVCSLSSCRCGTLARTPARV